MFTGEYRFKFYLNARHYVNFQNIDSKIHPHTWELVLHVKNRDGVFVRFSDIEADIRDLLSGYEGSCLNDIEPFTKLIPTLENIGEVFAGSIGKKLTADGWLLLGLEISESPARTYIITPDPTAEGGDSGDKLPSDSAQIPGNLQIPGNSQIQGNSQLQGNSQDVSMILQDSSGGIAHDSEGQPCDTESQLTVIENQTQINANPGVVKPSRFIWYLPIGIMAALLVGGALFWFITKSGSYPWGSDSWYHLFKGHLLYESIRQGNIYPLYSDIWYNGIEPLRYWAPLPHYVLAALEFLTAGNTALSYNLFIVLAFTAGAAGWFLWGLRTGRRKLAFVLALLWFFLPDNLRVLFSEGNLSRVAVTAIFPFLLLEVITYFDRSGANSPDEHQKCSLPEKPPYGSLIAIAVLMLAITFCHAMIAAMVAVTLTIFAIFYGFTVKKMKWSLHIVAAIACGIASAGIWLVPALSGGLLGMDGEAVKELASGLTYPALDSLNPLLRLNDPNVFYFGVSILAFAIFGLLFGSKKAKAAFVLTVIIFAGTTKALLPLIIKLPLSQVFWMMRFTPLAMGVFFAGLLLWKDLKKELLAAILVLVIADSAISFSLLAHDSSMPETSMQILDLAAAQTSNRLALFDASTLGSFPSFYLSFKGSEPVKQVFGSGWQGAATAENIVWLNTALEKHWYGYLFDRCLEQGADTVTITKAMSSDESELLAAAEKAGYKLSVQSSSAWTFKYPASGSFGTVVNYEGLGIGKYAAGMSLVFPQMETGGKEYLDDYSLGELVHYKLVYLSGFRYRDKTKAEELVKSLSEKGVKVLVDLNNAQEDLLTSRPDFLGVLAENTVFEEKLPGVDTSGGRLEFINDIPKVYPQWRAQYLENLDHVQAGTYFDNQQMDIIGTKWNSNIVFVGMNLPYYAMLTGDTTAVKLLETTTGLRAGELPQRETVPLKVETNGNSIILHADKDNVMTGIANLDTFTAVKGSYCVRQNFVRMQGRDLILEAGYPKISEGLEVSTLGVIGLAILIFAVKRRKNPVIINAGRVDVNA